jgi:hypothetical protein
VEPDGFGGIEPQLAINSSTAFAAVNDLAFTYKSDSWPRFPSVTRTDHGLNQAVAERSLSTRIWPGSNGTTSFLRCHAGLATMTNVSLSPVHGTVVVTRQHDCWHHSGYNAILCSDKCTRRH